MSKQDETLFRDTAVEAFRGAGDLELMLSDIGLHKRHWPDRHDLTPSERWDQALHVLADSDVDEGQIALLRRALKDRPRNPVFSKLAARYSTTAAAAAGGTTDSGPAAAASGTDKWDFFVSYTQKDQPWAEWIAWTLEERGYQVLNQAWDFVGGTSWTNKMQEGVLHSTRMIAVLSAAYGRSAYGTAEWQAMFRLDPLGEQRRLIPVRVEDCPWPGLLNNTGCDLAGLGRQDAEQRLLRCVEGAVKGRLKPLVAPPFPGKAGPSGPPDFPGDSHPDEV